MNDEVVKRPEQRFKLGIIGHGFVGKAIDYAFSTDYVDKFVVDPKYSGNTLQDLIDWQPNCVFICAPTPSKDDGSIDTSIVDEAVMKLINSSEAFIVIKSTITPDAAERLTRYDSRIVYNPEFLNEANAKMDIINAPYMVMGVTAEEAGQHLEGLYNHFSICNPAQAIMLSPVEAAFFKYAVNTFLATKVTFMNQLKQVMDEYGGSYNQLHRALMADQRIGYSHMKIPGPDGKKGFGGACFPKDLSAFIDFVERETEVDPTVFKQVRDTNNVIRSQYDLDEREMSNNVDYGQAKEEQ